MRNRIIRSLPFFLVLSLFLCTTTNIFAHGGEDHGDDKPKSTANAKGIVTHSSRLGDIEVMVKHTALEPDQPAEGRLFITLFETNVAFINGVSTIEIEALDGTIFKVIVEKGENPGTYNLKFPAVPQGSYTMRANISHGGEVDTATFSGIEVKPTEVAAITETSWFTNIVISILFGIVVMLLVGLLFLVWRFADSPKGSEGPVSV